MKESFISVISNNKKIIQIMILFIIGLQFFRGPISYCGSFILCRLDAIKDINSMNLSEKEKKEMNYEYLKDDIKELVFNRKTKHAKVKFQFRDSPQFDILESYEGIPIETISLSDAPVGGEEPYIFTKVSGPEWINVSRDGKIIGTPVREGANEQLVVRVTENGQKQDEINISVLDTKARELYKEPEKNETEDGRLSIENLLVTSSIRYYDKEDKKLYGEGYNIEDHNIDEMGVCDATEWGIFKGEGDELICEINEHYSKYFDQIYIIITAIEILSLLSILIGIIFGIIFFIKH